MSVSIAMIYDDKVLLFFVVFIGAPNVKNVKSFSSCRLSE